VIITTGLPVPQLCCSQPCTGFSARTGPATIRTSATSNLHSASGRSLCSFPRYSAATSSACAWALAASPVTASSSVRPLASANPWTWPGPSLVVRSVHSGMVIFGISGPYRLPPDMSRASISGLRPAASGATIQHPFRGTARRKDRRRGSDDRPDEGGAAWLPQLPCRLANAPTGIAGKNNSEQVYPPLAHAEMRMSDHAPSRVCYLHGGSVTLAPGLSVLYSGLGLLNQSGTKGIGIGLVLHKTRAVTSSLRNR
jgi:hypothetical protein